MQMATIHPIELSPQIILMPHLNITYHLRPKMILKGETPMGKFFLLRLKNSRRQTQRTDFHKSNKIIAIMAIDHETVKIVPQMAEDAMIRRTTESFMGTIIKISSTSSTMAKIGNDFAGSSKSASFQAG
jgi:hypothetical protein